MDIPYDDPLVTISPCLTVEIIKLVVDDEYSIQKKQGRIETSISPPLVHSSMESKLQKFDIKREMTLNKCLEYTLESNFEHLYWQLNMDLILENGAFDYEVLTLKVNILNYMDAGRLFCKPFWIHFQGPNRIKTQTCALIQFRTTKPLRFALPIKYDFKHKFDLSLTLDETRLILTRKANFSSWATLDRNSVELRTIFKNIYPFRIVQHMSNHGLIDILISKLIGNKGKQDFEGLGLNWELMENDLAGESDLAKGDRTMGLQEIENVEIEDQQERNISFEATINDLPDEILFNIFKHLDPTSRGYALMTCKRWFKLIYSNYFKFPYVDDSAVCNNHNFKVFYTQLFEGIISMSRILGAILFDIGNNNDPYLITPYYSIFCEYYDLLIDIADCTNLLRHISVTQGDKLPTIFDRYIYNFILVHLVARNSIISSEYLNINNYLKDKDWLEFIVLKDVRALLSNGNLTDTELDRVLKWAVIGIILSAITVSLNKQNAKAVLLLLKQKYRQKLSERYWYYIEKDWST